MEEVNEENCFWTLDTLPVEIFLHIANYIPARFLYESVRLVSKHFHGILTNEASWAIRQKKKYGHYGDYPPVGPPPTNTAFSFSQACIQREEQFELWTVVKPTMTELHCHIACVDAVHLFCNGNKLVTGSRDRSFAVWDLNQSQAPIKLTQKQSAHSGWIWAFQIIQNQLVSASWDCWIKSWDLEKTVDEIQKFKCKSACLCLASSGTVVGAGTFNKEICLFDMRAGGGAVGNYSAHKQCVLAIGMDESRVVSCGEDGYVTSYERRMNRVSSQIKLPSISSKNYPKCLSFGDTSQQLHHPPHLFYVGDIEGSVHLFDLSNFSLIQSYQKVHKRAVQGVFHTLGSVFTCSSDGELHVHEPSRGLHRIHTYTLDKVELPQVHCLNNRLALAGGDAIVRVFTPPTPPPTI